MSFSNIQEQGRSISIKDEGVVIATNISSIDFAGAGVTGSAVVSAVTETIAGGGGVSTETPTGTVNGSNTAFTVLNTPKFLIIDDLVYFENLGYTLSGLNITVDPLVVPTNFIRSVY